MKAIKSMKVIKSMTTEKNRQMQLIKRISMTPIKKISSLGMLPIMVIVASVSPSVSAQLTTTDHGHTTYYADGGQVKDKLASLIELKTLEYKHNVNILYDARNSARDSVYDEIYEMNTSYDDSSLSGDLVPNFEIWLNQYTNRHRAKTYHQYLIRHLGESNVPPMSQLLITARSWKKCGAEPYAVPPRHLWRNIIPTLRLIADLKRQGVLPKDVVIRSGYRNRGLNSCVGGARKSKHLVNSGVDLWSPSYLNSPWKKYEVQDHLCDFWLYQGRHYKFGLGLYKSGSIHIDTSKYRKWGSNHSSGSSPCRAY